MLKKTFRSALSMLLVFCLLLGMSGNAIAWAAEEEITWKNVSQSEKLAAALADQSVTHIRLTGNLNPADKLTITRDVTIDMNGKNLKASLLIMGDVEVTIKNGKIVGGDKNENSGFAIWAYNGAEVTLDNVTVEGDLVAAVVQQNAVLNLVNGTKVTADNASNGFECGDGVRVYAGELNVGAGCEINGVGENYGDGIEIYGESNVNIEAGASVAGYDAVMLYGGELVSAGDLTGVLAAVQFYKFKEDAAKATINGGVLSATDANGYSIYNHDDSLAADVTITAGEFENEVSLQDDDAAVVKGGTFVDDVSEYVPVGYVMEDGEVIKTCTDELDPYLIVEKVAANCTDKGYTLIRCVCGENTGKIYTEDALGHIMEGADNKAPDCDEPGYKAHECVRPGCDYRVEDPVPATGHSYVGATCYEPGKCSVCGEEKLNEDGEVAEPALGCDFQLYDPTDCDKGYKCTRCGAHVFLPDPHNWVSTGFSGECGEALIEHFKCTICGSTEDVVHDQNKVPHVPGEEATCTTAQTCVACGEVITPALGHKYDENGVCTVCTAPCEHYWDGTSAEHYEPTCTEKGYKSEVCLICGITNPDTITWVDPLGHDWDGTDCTRCDATHEHYWDGTSAEHWEPTCEDEGYKSEVCLICGIVNEKTETTVPALGHTWDEGEITTKPNCTDTGIKTYTCTRCGDTKEEEVAANGHSWSTDPVYGDGTNHYLYCTVCGALNENANEEHDWDEGYVAVAPTCEDLGIYLYTCKVCGEHKAIALAAIGHSYGEWYETVAPEFDVAGEEQHDCTICGHSETREIEALDRILGDVNGDGVVNVIDAVLVLNYDAGNIGDDDLFLVVADVNGDGFVNVIDAVLILNFDAGNIDKFPAVQ